MFGVLLSFKLILNHGFYSPDILSLKLGSRSFLPLLGDLCSSCKMTHVEKHNFSKFDFNTKVLVLHNKIEEEQAGAELGQA